MYVGHLHNEFTERELRGYFGQFGNIVRLRLSRSKKVHFFLYKFIRTFKFQDWQ